MSLKIIVTILACVLTLYSAHSQVRNDTSGIFFWDFVKLDSANAYADKVQYLQDSTNNALLNMEWDNATYQTYVNRLNSLVRELKKNESIKRYERDLEPRGTATSLQILEYLELLKKTEAYVKDDSIFKDSIAKITREVYNAGKTTHVAASHGLDLGYSFSDLYSDNNEIIFNAKKNYVAIFNNKYEGNQALASSRDGNDLRCHYLIRPNKSIVDDDLEIILCNDHPIRVFYGSEHSTTPRGKVLNFEKKKDESEKLYGILKKQKFESNVESFRGFRFQPAKYTAISKSVNPSWHMDVLAFRNGCVYYFMSDLPSCKVDSVIKIP